MAKFRKHSMASAIALAISLTACGGGGGGGGGLVSTPPPPPPPPPPPVAVVSAPAAATAPNAALFPVAVAGGATMQAHPKTTFPLLESVVTIGSLKADADPTTMDAGATLAFDATGNFNNDQYLFSAPGLGLNDVSLLANGYYCYAQRCGSASDTNVFANFPDPATSGLSWTTFGVWSTYRSASSSFGAFVTGYRTPDGAVPTSGTASYGGKVNGRVIVPEATGTHGVLVYELTGDAALQANFAGGSITGNLTNMKASTAPWNSVSLVGAISGGLFSGTSAATSSPTGKASLLGSATGTFNGMFFGPTAQELGAVWTLYDGHSSAIGAIGAKTGP